MGKASTTTGTISLFNSTSAYKVSLSIAAQTVGNATLDPYRIWQVVNDTVCLAELGNYNGGTNAVNGKISFNNSTNANTVGLRSFGSTSTS